jgi:plastocyanin
MKRLALSLVLLVALPACGDDAPSAGDAAGSTRPCEPVGEELADAADATVEVGLDEYRFTLAAASVRAGTITFDVTNDGDENHELAFLPGGGDVPLDDTGAPDEAALEQAGAFELEAFGPDQDCQATYELAAGDYTLFCLVEAEDGTTHLSKGMRSRLQVT